MEKFYLPMQIKALLPSDMYKVLDALMTFQKEGGTITYSKRNAEFLHLPVEITDQAIQTAINCKLIEPIEQAGNVYKFRINQTTLETAKLTPLTEIPNKPILKLSNEITFKKEMGTKQPSTEALLEQIRQLQAQLMTQVKNENNEGNDGLPW